ncbi:MAG: hypothetical protein ACI4O9_04925 [Akkermansia sp.]
MDVSPEPRKASPRYPRMLPAALLGLLSTAAGAEEVPQPAGAAPNAAQRSEAPAERAQRPPQLLEGEVIRELPRVQLPPAPDRRPPQRTPGKPKLPPKR